MAKEQIYVLAQIRSIHRLVLSKSNTLLVTNIDYLVTLKEESDDLRYPVYIAPNHARMQERHWNVDVNKNLAYHGDLLKYRNIGRNAMMLYPFHYNMYTLFSLGTCHGQNSHLLLTAFDIIYKTYFLIHTFHRQA